MTTAWFDGPFTQVRRADAILLPCAFRDPREAEGDWFDALVARTWTPMPSFGLDAPPGTLTPDNGRTVVLRVHGGAYMLWQREVMDAFRAGTVLPLEAKDEHTGAPWKVYLDSTAPVEFRALVAGPYTITLPLPVEPIRETEPYFLRRYPHLDTRPLRERL